MPKKPVCLEGIVKYDMFVCSVVDVAVIGVLFNEAIGAWKFSAEDVGTIIWNRNGGRGLVNWGRGYRSCRPR